MKVTPTALPEVLVLEPDVFVDERGFFMESWNQREFDAAVGHPVRFVQDNHSLSRRGVLRGLHYQLPPHEQGKLVRVVAGRAFDVAVDLRRSSPRFGQWTGVELSADNRRQVWIPPGFAHGFLALEDGTQVLYKATGHYAPQAQRILRWNDEHVGILWPDMDQPPTLSPSDASAEDLTRADRELW